MFYAKGNVSQKIDLYLALLEKSISEGNKSNYWTFFSNAFVDAHQVAIGKISYFEINKDWYDVVNILVKNNSDYFKHLDVGQINQTVFLDVKKFMGSLKQTNTVVN